VTDKQYRQHLNKLDKLKKIQLAMLEWLKKNKNKEEGYNTIAWKERLSYVLSCEKKDLNKNDIKMLNNIWNHYK
jgi:hypothetical protein